MVPLFMPRPYLVTVHDLSSLIYDKRAGWRHDLHLYRIRRGLRRASRILAVSSATARDVSALLGIPADRTRIIYSAPDPQFTDAGVSAETELECQRVMERYQVNSPFLLYSGTVRPQKNLPRLVEAFALVRGELDQHPDYRDLRLLIIGDEVSKAPAIRQAVMQAHVASFVRFLGFVPMETLRAFYRAATAFVFPSLYEGFGLPPLEAMASGVPVITSNTSSLPEVVGEAAVTVDPENVFEIARGIKDVLLDHSLRHRLVAAGHAQVARFDWDRTAKEVLDVYASIGPGGRSRREVPPARA
jgi:glycosyltransferase involved in cell wall biosynthesis